MVRQILLWNKTYTSSNPRNGLLIRLMATQRDAADTMVESFAEMRSLLTQDVLNEKWGSKVRNHMASLQSMFDAYSRKQHLVSLPYC